MRLFDPVRVRSGRASWARVPALCIKGVRTRFIGAEWCIDRCEMGATAVESGPSPTTRQKSFSTLAVGFSVPLFLLAPVFFAPVPDAFPEQYRIAVLFNAAVASVIAYFGVVFLIPSICKYMLRRGMFGLDLNKRGTAAEKNQVPESMGLVAGTVYVIVVIGFSTMFRGDSRLSLEINAALTSILFTLLLGFSDDVLDWPWRMKLVLPTIATLPLLAAYDGETAIMVPMPLRFMLGTWVELGILYKVYMGLLAIFCTNSINIYAGINGLEVGQSLIIAFSILILNVFGLDSSEVVQANHYISMMLIMPFIAVTLALFVYNRYPSEVFVGDTFTYFAGMTFAVVGILGHFSKTLMLLFIPQILNFLYSLPQLVLRRWFPCPRHRVPRFNPETGKLEPIRTNLTLLNLALMIFGPMTEKQLTQLLLAFQMLCSLVAFVIRFPIASHFYPEQSVEDHSWL